MELLEWVNHYYNWRNPTKGERVKPIRFLGLRSKSNYIYKYEHNDALYCAELYECITENGIRKICAFYVPYTENVKTDKGYYKRQNNEQKYDDINCLTDSLNTYYTGKLEKNNLLIKKQNELNQLIENVLTEFKSVNNFENADYKMGLQIYLERLQTPCLITKKQWKAYQQKNPYLTEKIINNSLILNHTRMI